jgi:hypothetical protein
MTSKPNSFVPPAAEIRRALRGLGASDVVMLMRQSLELRGYDHAVAIADALDDERKRDSGVRICEAVARFVGGERERALALLEEVLSDSPEHLVAREVRGEMLLRSGKRDVALAELVAVAERYPDYPGLQGLLSVLLMPGPHYRDVLAAIHRTLAPVAYLEIGVESGQTLSLATSAEVAVGVDPADQPLETRIPPGARVVRLTSDDFFARYSCHDVFGERRVDLAFIDGMHLFEYALRDFLNCERWCDPTSTIVMHDCVPILPVAAERERRTRFWVGDTWKAVVAVARRRPDLKIRTILAPPSGLVVIRRLNPSSTRLSEELDLALAELADVSYDFAPGTYPPEFNVVTNDEKGFQEALA